MKVIQMTFAAILACLFIACSSSSNNDTNIIVDPEEPTRNFKMGFTPWLYEASLEAIDVTYSRLTSHGDIIKHQFHGGIPWQESLDQTEYHANVEAEIQGRLDQTPAGVDVFLAIDSLNTSRDALSPNWGAEFNQDRTGDWEARSWSSPQVIQAYINFSIDMIDRFNPTHFEYGTEASELILNNPTGYIEYLIFAEAVHTALKALYPNLKLMTSVALKSPGSTEMQLIEASYAQLMPYTDVLGISIYPYVFYNHTDRGNPANMPSNWLSHINGIAGTTPIAISETGWIGEDLTIDEFQYSEQSDSSKQNDYASRLLIAANSMNAEFVIWWSIADFDTLWENELAQDPVAKIWKDIGLYEQNQNPRTALQTWDMWLSYQYVGGL